MTALAVFVALVGAMFVAMQSASAISVGACKADGSTMLGIGDTCTIAVEAGTSTIEDPIATNDKDGDDSNEAAATLSGTADQVQSSDDTIALAGTEVSGVLIVTAQKVGRATVTYNDYTAAEGATAAKLTTKTFSISVQKIAVTKIEFGTGTGDDFEKDSDGTVKAGTDVTVRVTVSYPDGTDAANNADGDTNVSVQLSVPSTGLSLETGDAGETTQRQRMSVPVATAGMSPTLTADFTLITDGAPDGEYDVSATASQGDSAATPSSTLVTSAKISGKLSIGDPGTNVDSIVLSLARTSGTGVSKRHAAATDTSTAPETASEVAGEPIFLVANVANSKGNPANSSAIDTVTISAPGGSITVGASTGSSPQVLRDGDANAKTEFTVTKGTAGTVNVTVTAAGPDGYVRSESLTLILTGPATTLSLSDATETLLNQYKDHKDADDESDTDTDGRDNISLKLTAQDKAENSVAPTASATITVTGPDGAPVETVSNPRIVVSQSLKGATNTITLRVAESVTAANPLASGAYIVEAKDGTKKDTASFTVAGPTEMIELAADDMAPSAVGQAVAVTASLSDADGNPVADGTEVTFTATGSNAGVPVANRTGGTGAVKTKGGEAKALFVIATSGPGIISAVADGKSATVVLASTAGAVAEREPEPEVVSLDCLTETSGFSVYNCGVESSASELFGLVSGRGATAIHLWNGSAWVRYSVVDGVQIPGSSDFMVAENDILYISN